MKVTAQFEVQGAASDPGSIMSGDVSNILVQMTTDGQFVTVDCEQRFNLPLTPAGWAQVYAYASALVKEANEGAVKVGEWKPAKAAQAQP